MIYQLGPRAHRIYTALRDQIVQGELMPGFRLPSHAQLAVDFGVAPLTVRHALSQLEAEGLVSREHGRGTFVTARDQPAVLIAEDEAEMRALLSLYTRSAGYRPLPVSGPDEALGLLASDPSIVLIFSDVHMPDQADGIAFIRTARRRWPQLPLVVITGYPEDLAELHGTPECPVHILTKPVWAHQIEDVLRLARLVALPIGAAVSRAG
jgi:DNA-binding transcriptional regulator YhcF (GntR family)